MKRLLFIMIYLSAFIFSLYAQNSSDKLSVLKREEMVLSLEKEMDLRSANLKSALLRVKRENFVPDQYKQMAYSLIPIPLNSRQLLPSPLTLSRILSKLDLQPGDTVLVMGQGTAYTAALLQAMGMNTWILDREYEGDLSNQNRVKWSLGWNDWINMAPFDAIILHASHSSVPQDILEQLSDKGGKLVFPLQTDSGYQPLVYITRNSTSYSVETEGSGFFSKGD